MKHRRHLTRFATVLAVAALGWYGWGWWTAPRIDPRLIGEWMPIGDQGWYSERPVRLQPNGAINSERLDHMLIQLGYPTPSAGDLGYQLTTQWSVSENRLILDYKFRLRSELWTAYARDQWARWTGAPRLWTKWPFTIRDVEVYEIISVRDDELVLRGVTAANTLPEVTLRRVNSDSK